MFCTIYGLWISKRENEAKLEIEYWLQLFFQSSAQRALQESEKLFGDMLRSIERMQQEMIKLISTNKKAALNTAEGHMERLGHEIADLKRRDDELTQLSRTEDHIHFIQVTETQSAEHNKHSQS